MYKISSIFKNEKQTRNQIFIIESGVRGGGGGGVWVCRHVLEWVRRFEEEQKQGQGWGNDDNDNAAECEWWEQRQ